MKKKVLLVLILSFCLLMPNIKAKVVLKDDVENNTYIIGKYMFTRTPNEENNYKGELSTPLIMLASKTIDGSLEQMTIYYKNLFGEWKNGLTNETITAPESFEIENRNLRDILPTPELDCRFGEHSLYTDDSGNRVRKKSFGCLSSVVIDGTVNYATLTQTNFNDFEGGVEYYLLKNEDGSLPTATAYYDYQSSKFISSNKNLKLELIDDLYYEYTGSEPFYQVVSRIYYLDGEEKIYSEYSNIQTNGASAKFNLTSASVKLDATINENYAVNVDSSLAAFGPGLNSEVNYYNVKFKLNGVDTTKYMIKEYRVYSAVEALDGLAFEHFEDYENAEDGSDTLLYLYMESLAKDKYTKPHRFSGANVNAYLIADVNGETPFWTYEDMSATSALSKRLYWPEDEDDNTSREIVAKATICNLEQTECYEILPHLSSSTGNTSYVR